MNQAIVSAGIVLAANSALLLVSPGRFAAMRRASWMPGRVNSMVTWLGEHDGRARALAIAGAVSGVGLIAYGLSKVDPV